MAQKVRLFFLVLLTIWLMNAALSPTDTTVGKGTESVLSKTHYTAFLEEVRQGKIRHVYVDADKVTLRAERIDGTRLLTYAPHDPEMVNELLRHKVEISQAPAVKPGVGSFLASLLPMFILIGFLWYLTRGSGASKAMGFGRSRAKLQAPDRPKILLADVAGCSEAKEEVSELVEFLRDPAKYKKVGGRIPRGVLLVGEPGTGKTLLAKAIAGEAGVPFFSVSGSDFVEMFVGVGASRVRDMFTQAKAAAPCILFIDEIDAVGRQRGGGMGNSNDEREQTLNQLLVEMDGFEENVGVIVIAATNRPDVLDQALLRPGRFDRQVVIPRPDVRGRAQILEVHLRTVVVADDINVEQLARATPGFSGADLANLVNEAALLAVREKKSLVSMVEMERAKDKLLMGTERRSMIMSEQEKSLTAYHEAGHAIVGRLVPQHDPVYKVSIIPRGRALGVTMFLPERDRLSHTKQGLESSLASLYGGRAAEILIFGEDQVTTGASNDIERASELARNMVTRWGMAEEIGPILYDAEESMSYTGNTMSGRSGSGMSERRADAIDQAVRRILDEASARATQILRDNVDILHRMAHVLLQEETIDAKQIDVLMARQPLKGEKSMSTSSGKQGPCAQLPLFPSESLSLS